MKKKEWFENEALRTGKRFLALLFLTLVFWLAAVQAVFADEVQFSSVELGTEYFSAAISTDGDLWMWGENSSGQLGNQTFTDAGEPVKIMSNVAQVSLGYDFTAAVDNDGNLWLWGDNSYGKCLGDDAVESYNYPRKVEGLSNIVSVSLGYNYGAAIDVNGDLWMWGSNFYGQLAASGSGYTSTPFLIMEEVAQVSLGKYTTAVIKSDHTLWTWGYNGSGQLGNGTTESTNTPQQIMTNVKSVSMGYSFGLAIDTKGNIWSWGNNSSGQLGIGNTTTSYIPVKVMEKVKAVSAGKESAAAIKKDNSLWTWGSNQWGQLGTGNKSTQYVPVCVMEDVKSVCMARNHCAAIGQDKTLWVWGDNSSNALGLNEENVDASSISDVLGSMINSDAAESWERTVPVQLSVTEETDTTEELLFKLDQDCTYLTSGGMAEITGYTGAGTSVYTVPDSLEEGALEVASIGDYAYENAEFESVVLPGTITAMGANPFRNCSSLGEFVVLSGNDVFYVENGALIESETGRLVAVALDHVGEEYEIPDGVTEIGAYAFYNSSLTQVTIPAGVTVIGEGAFAGCDALTTVTFAKKSKLTEISDYAFKGCTALTGLELPDSLTSIGAYAFSECFDGEEAIDVPEDVAYIGTDAFEAETVLSVRSSSYAYKWALMHEQPYQINKTVVEKATGLVADHFLNSEEETEG